MEVSIERIKKDIEALSNYNSTPGIGYTRFSYSKEDRQAKDYLIDEMKKLAMQITVDGIGNIRAKYNSSNEPSIIVGSHIDTVLHGGRFDGVVGVVGALEAIRVLNENKIKTNHPIELIIFAEEEGSNFGTATSGSKALVGGLSLIDLKKLSNQKGESYYDVLKGFGLNPENLGKERLEKGNALAMLELHIEQGIVLDRSKIPIGIVKGISGKKLLHIEIHGESNHAGATPMNMRKDPMVVASQIISSINSTVIQKGSESTVATVGKIECSPNVSNIIPGFVKFAIDIRDVDNEAVSAVSDAIASFAIDLAAKANLRINIDKPDDLNGVQLSKKIIRTIEEIAQEKGVAYKLMNSGALHDAALIAGLANTGMIFVPSKDGRSHVSEEHTSYGDIKTGCDILLEAIIRLDKYNN